MNPWRTSTLRHLRLPRWPLWMWVCLIVGLLGIAYTLECLTDTW